MNNSSNNQQGHQGSLVSVNLVVHNGEKYIRQCLDSILAQTYRNFEINILDNSSTDSTVKIIETEIENRKSKIENLTFAKSKINLGTWPGQEELLKHSRGEYIVALSVDVVLDNDFITEAVKVLDGDKKIGAAQPKVYRYGLRNANQEAGVEKTKIIDTAGFKIYKSRRIVNVGHGEQDDSQYGREREVFAVEGAVPVLRRQALEDCRLKTQGGKIIDPDFFWYGDDLDLAWRIRLFGWKEVFAPKVIAYHDRQTTKALGGGWQRFMKIRKTVPMFKRQLDWRNTTLAIIKNDFALNFICDLPWILWRQLRLWGYFLLFEPTMILEIFGVAKLLPKMLKRRSEIMMRAKVSAREMRKWTN